MLPQKSNTTIPDPFAAAEAAHGAANPDPHRWADRGTTERYAFAFERFETCTARDGKEVETIVGQLSDGTWSREWLFPPNPGSKGWRAQQLEFIERVRADLSPGDILVMELGAERPKATDPDQTSRPFSASHHPVAGRPAAPRIHAPLDVDEAAAAAVAADEAEADELDQAAGEVDDEIPFA